MRSALLLVVPALLWCTAPIFGSEPFSGVYIHPAPFAEPSMQAVEREALMDKTLDAIQACGFTTVIPYANTSSGSVYWPGTELPMAGSADWDTLGIFCSKARSRGLKVMPALCVLVSGHDAPAGILERHPDWAFQNEGGQPLGWISPCSESARAWVVALVKHLADHIKPDGILLDYMRLPNEKGVSLDPASLPAFISAAPGQEEAQVAQVRLQRFKESSLSVLMASIAQALRAHSPSLRIGLYSWGPHVPFDHPVAQCWPDWVHAGYLDLINISGYCYRDNYGDAYLEAFRKRLKDSADLVRNSGGRTALSFALGVNTSHGAIPDAEEISRYLAIAREQGYSGVAAFAWRGLEPFVDAVQEKGYFRLSQPVVQGSGTPVTLRMTVDFGRDEGQHFGSLLQIKDTAGRIVLGAGFQGAYNTYYRANRFALQLYERVTPELDEVQVETFPRPTPGTCHYLFEGPDGLYASDRKDPCATVRWDREQRAWIPSGPPAFQAGNACYVQRPNRLEGSEGAVFSFDPNVGTAGLYYYAEGRLFFHVALAGDPERRTRIYACPWNGGSQEVVSLDQAVVLALAAPGEFPYAYGQLHGDVFIATNNGGVYRFGEGRWETLRPADPKTSYQVYAMLNYGDRLLMGQYPTGEIFEMVGKEIVRLPGWPPRPSGVSANAREAQSLALYRGELFAGVWPWGELWRLPAPDGSWHFLGRAFSEPALESVTNAPYEREVADLGEKAANLWGQRITSLVPYDGGLLASTANKNGAPFEERLQFLAKGLHEEYGSVKRLVLPGHASAAIRWTDQPVTFEFVLGKDDISVFQDGAPILSLSRDHLSLSPGTTFHVNWGQGIYGPLNGRLLSTDISPANP